MPSLIRLSQTKEALTLVPALPFMRISVLDCVWRRRSWYTVISPTSGVLSRTNTVTTKRKMTSSPRTKDKKGAVLKGDWMISQICWEQPAYLCGSQPCSPNDISSVEQNTELEISHLLIPYNNWLPMITSGGVKRVGVLERSCIE